MNVYVRNKLIISISNCTTDVNMDTDQIRLQSGVTCSFSTTSCLDQVLGYSFWTIDLPHTDRCLQNGAHVMYEGSAHFLDSPSTHGLSTDKYIFIDRPDRMFAMKIYGTTDLGGTAAHITTVQKCMRLKQIIKANFTFGTNPYT